MSAVVGLNCKLYRNTGTYGTPVWNEVTAAQDVTLNLSKTMADAKYRGVTWLGKLPTLKEATLDLGLIGDASIDDHDAIRDAYIADTVLDIAFADGAIATTGTKYFRADFYVSDFPMGQPLTETAAVNSKLELAYSTNARAFTTVA